MSVDRALGSHKASRVSTVALNCMHCNCNSTLALVLKWTAKSDWRGSQSSCVTMAMRAWLSFHRAA